MYLPSQVTVDVNSASSGCDKTVHTHTHTLSNVMSFRRTHARIARLKVNILTRDSDWRERERQREAVTRYANQLGLELRRPARDIRPDTG